MPELFAPGFVIQALLRLILMGASSLVVMGSSHLLMPPRICGRWRSRTLMSEFGSWFDVGLLFVVLLLLLSPRTISLGGVGNGGATSNDSRGDEVCAEVAYVVTLKRDGGCTYEGSLLCFASLGGRPGRFLVLR